MANPKTPNKKVRHLTTFKNFWQGNVFWHPATQEFANWLLGTTPDDDPNEIFSLYVPYRDYAINGHLVSAIPLETMTRIVKTHPGTAILYFRAIIAENLTEGGMGEDRRVTELVSAQTLLSWMEERSMPSNQNLERLVQKGVDLCANNVLLVEASRKRLLERVADLPAPGTTQPANDPTEVLPAPAKVKPKATARKPPVKKAPAKAEAPKAKTAKPKQPATLKNFWLGIPGAPTDWLNMSEDQEKSFPVLLFGAYVKSLGPDVEHNDEIEELYDHYSAYLLDEIEPSQFLRHFVDALAYERPYVRGLYERAIVSENIGNLTLKQEKLVWSVVEEGTLSKWEDQLFGPDEKALRLIQAKTGINLLDGSVYQENQKPLKKAKATPVKNVAKPVAKKPAVKKPVPKKAVATKAVPVKPAPKKDVPFVPWTGYVELRDDCDFLAEFTARDHARCQYLLEDWENLKFNASIPKEIYREIMQTPHVVALRELWPDFRHSIEEDAIVFQFTNLRIKLWADEVEVEARIVGQNSGSQILRKITACGDIVQATGYLFDYFDTLGADNVDITQGDTIQSVLRSAGVAVDDDERFYAGFREIEIEHEAPSELMAFYTKNADQRPQLLELGQGMGAYPFSQVLLHMGHAPRNLTLDINNARACIEPPEGVYDILGGTPIGITDKGAVVPVAASLESMPDCLTDESKRYAMCKYYGLHFDPVAKILHLPYGKEAMRFFDPKYSVAKIVYL